MKRTSLAVLAISTIFAGPATTLAQQAKTFSDWSAACDNLRGCTALGLSGTDDPVFLKLSRDGTAEAAPHWSIGWSLDDLPPGTKIKLSFDDPALPGLPAEPLVFDAEKQPFVYEVPSSADAAFLASLRRAGSLKAELVLPAGKTLPESQSGTATISLKGAVAALIWLDDQQKRVGTVTALIKTGDKPAVAVPALPPEPVVRAASPVPQDALPKTPPAAILKALKAADCDDTLSAAAAAPDVARLSATTVLWGATCKLAAYNSTTLYFVIENGTARPVTFPAPQGESQDPPNELVNPSFEPKTMTMATFAKGRGLGDCGSLGAWVWDGKAFVLTAFSAMDECRGVPPDAWPTLYRARVDR